MTTYGGGRKVPIFLYQHTFLGKILPPFVFDKLNTDPCEQ